MTTSSPLPLPPFDWDIFCCVVDNFGDIGVTWRLARQLEQEGRVRYGSGWTI
jgi:hypothetical protein